MSDKLGKNIRYLREFYGETQEELAEFLGKGKSGQISDYENGKIKPSIGDVVKIAAHYQVTIDDLRFDDYSNLTKNGFLQFFDADLEGFERFFSAFFPILFEADEQDIYLRALIVYHCEAREQGEEGILYCVEHYIKNPQRTDDVFQVNRLSFICFLLYLRCFMQKDVVGLINVIDESKGKKIRKQRIKDYIFRVQSLYNHSDVSERLYNRAVAIMISLQKSSSYEVRQLAVYLNAMFYFLGFVDNDSMIVQNRLVGMEMLDNLIRLENPWAIGFAKALQSFANLG